MDVERPVTIALVPKMTIPSGRHSTMRRRSRALAARAAFGAVALGVGHRHAERQVLILDLMQVGDETLVIVGALVGIDAVRRLPDRIERIVREIAFRPTAVLAKEPDRLELGEEVGGRLIDMQHAVDLAPARGLRREHQGPVLWLVGEVIGGADSVDAGGEDRVIGHAFDAASVHEHDRVEPAEDFRKSAADISIGVSSSMGGGHEMRLSSGYDRIF